MSNEFECTGYHKSSIDNAQNSVRWQSFHISSKEDLWLGEGVYFWQRYYDAVWWKGNYTNPAIVSTDIICPRDLFLDLDNPEEKKAFEEYFEQVFLELKDAKLSVGVEWDSIVGAFSCNHFKKEYGIRLIRYSFPQRSKRPQLCSTGTEILSNIRLVSVFVNGEYRTV